MDKEMIGSGELKLRTGASRMTHAVLVYSAPMPLFFCRSHGLDSLLRYARNDPTCWHENIAVLSSHA
jgi:hypothetical protein